MDNVKGILLLVVIALAAGCFLLFVRSSTLSAQNDKAQVLALAVQDLMDTMDVSCPVSAGQYEQLAEKCVQPLLLENDFGGDALKQPKDLETGYLVIKNKNARTYQSENFLFYFNRQLVQTGCTIVGEIGRGITCRFDFSNTCNEGDILEVFYEYEEKEQRVFLHTC